MSYTCLIGGKCNPREAAMVQVIEFRPRETRVKRRTYSKPADVIPMPAQTVSGKVKAKPNKRVDLAALHNLTRPHEAE